MPMSMSKTFMIIFWKRYNFIGTAQYIAVLGSKENLFLINSAFLFLEDCVCLTIEKALYLSYFCFQAIINYIYTTVTGILLPKKFIIAFQVS